MSNLFRSKIIKVLLVFSLFPIAKPVKAGGILNGLVGAAATGACLIITYFSLQACDDCMRDSFLLSSDDDMRIIEKFSEPPRFEQWYKRCEELPKYEDVYSFNKYKYSTLTKTEFERAIKELFAVLRESSFANSDNWINGNAPSVDYFDFTADSLSERTYPRGFVQKIVESSDTEIYLHADIHADIHSLNYYMQFLIEQGVLDDNFHIIKPDTYVTFLGDYVDRGIYSTEVLYVLARLKAENPEKVILLQGNHEDLIMNERDGFIGSKDIGLRGEILDEPGELQVKFGLNADELAYMKKLMEGLYNFLPQAVFFGSKVKIDDDCVDYALLCHGGLEPRFNPKHLLSDSRALLYQCIEDLDLVWLEELEDEVAANFEASKMYSRLGFTWNDFDLSGDLIKFNKSRGSCYTFGKAITQKFLRACSSKKDKVSCVLRGHQHGDRMMCKMVQHGGLFGRDSKDQWSGKNGEVISLKQRGSVWTLNVSPGSGYGESNGYDYDTHAVLKIGGGYKNWQLAPRKIRTRYSACF